MKRGVLIILLVLVLFLIIACVQTRGGSPGISSSDRGFDNFQESLEQIEQEEECEETRVSSCNSIQGAMKIGNKDGFLKYHCNSLYFIEFPNPESGIGGESVLAENIEGDKYNLFGEVIEVKPEEDCSLIMNTGEEATGTNFEFGDLSGFSRIKSSNGISYIFNDFEHKIAAVKEVRLSSDIEFGREDAYLDSDLRFDRDDGILLFNARNPGQRALNGQVSFSIFGQYFANSNSFFVPIIGTIYATIEKDGFVWIKFKEI